MFTRPSVDRTVLQPMLLLIFYYMKLWFSLKTRLYTSLRCNTTLEDFFEKYFVLFCFRPFVLLSVCLFSFCHFVLLSFCPFVLFVHVFLLSFVLVSSPIISASIPCKKLRALSKLVSQSVSE